MWLNELLEHVDKAIPEASRDSNRHFIFGEAAEVEVA